MVGINSFYFILIFFSSPQRWYPVCEQALTLTFGSAGLTTLKKLEESGGKLDSGGLSLTICVT